MKKIILAFVFMLVFATGAVCFAGLHDFPNVAVLPFRNKAITSDDVNYQEQNLISEFVIEELIDTGRFNVLERDELMAVTNEHSLNMTGLVDPATAAQIGRLAGVKYLVAGSVAGLTTKESGASYDNSGLGSVGGTKHTVIANVNARIFDVETGRILLACHGVGKSSSAHIEFKLNVTKNTPYETEVIDPDTGDPNIQEAEETTVTSHIVKIGSVTVSQVQVHNAIAKAVTNLVFNKNYGLLAKMDGKAKRNKM